MRPHIGEACLYHGTEYRCYDVCGRCSHWVSADATMRRRYDVHGQWSDDPILPTVRADTGQLVGNTGQRMERILAIAWHNGAERGHVLTNPQRGLHADNLTTTSTTTSTKNTMGSSIRGEERTDDGDESRTEAADVDLNQALARRRPQARRPSACVSRVLAVAPGCASIAELAAQCQISSETAYNYIAKGTALVGLTAGVIDLVDGRLRAAVESLSDDSGPLSAVAARVVAVDPTVWDEIESPYNQLRIVRMIVEDARGSV
jgi:hypothetical protein